MRKSGFTIVELLIVIVIVGATTAFALPRMNTAARHEAVRSARREVITQLMRAKAIAATRGCRSSLQIRPSTGSVWVEACRDTGTARDTVGPYTQIGGKYSVTVTSTADSLPFAPTSLGIAPAPITMTFARSGYTLTLNISSVGRASW